MTDQTFLLGPDQAIRLMALSVMLRDGELHLRSDCQPDALLDLAKTVLIDIGQEIALQMGGGA